MRRPAESFGIRGGMRVRRIGSDGDVNGHGHLRAPGLQQQAGGSMRAGASLSSARPSASPAPAPETISAAFHSRPVSSAAPKRPSGQHGFHVLTGLPRKRDFEIVDRGRAVHRKGCGEPAAHQVDQHRRETALDDMAAHAPDHRLALRPCRGDCIDHSPQRIAREDVRQAFEQPATPEPGL